MNVIESRYASQEMREIWSSEAKVRMERQLWIKVLEFQVKHGLDVSDNEISDYRSVVESIDLESILIRERNLKHDVKARIEEFNYLAGHQLIHLAMTSRDVTENIEAWQLHKSMLLIRDRAIATLVRFANIAERYSEVVVVARTHNVPAQLTTLGKRFATLAEELILALEKLENLIERFPIRGIKGPVGTSQDILDLCGEHGTEIDVAIAGFLGIEKILVSPSQIYPRSLDFDVISTLFQLASAPSNLAIQIRLMTSLDLAAEGFADSQIGSSAMPHKRNPRSCERINGLTKILGGHLNMISGLIGNQWNEGDVSDSSVRRVALADAFYAIDGILITTMDVLDGLFIDTLAVRDEVFKHLPFLISTKMLLGLVKNGKGREDAYSIVKDITSQLRLNSSTEDIENLSKLLLTDSRLSEIRRDIEVALSDPSLLIGASVRQVTQVVEQIRNLALKWPNGAAYQPPVII